MDGWFLRPNRRLWYLRWSGPSILFGDGGVFSRGGEGGGRSAR